MKYGISTLTLLPYSLGKTGFHKSALMAQEAGYDGLQILPMGGWDWNQFNPENPRILSYEASWGYGGFSSFVFDNEHPIYCPSALYSMHDFDDSPNGHTVVEIHPDLSAEIKPYLDYYDMGGRFCWDTLHVRRTHRVKKDLRINWIKLLMELPRDAIRLVHVHPQLRELRDFLKGNGQTADMLHHLKMNNEIQDDVPIIIEALPLPVFNHVYIKKLLDVTSSILD